MLKDLFKYRTRIWINIACYALAIPAMLFFLGYWFVTGSTALEMLQNMWWIVVFMTLLAVVTTLVPPARDRYIFHWSDFFRWTEDGDVEEFVPN